MNYDQIQPFTQDGYYRVDVSIRDFADSIRRYEKAYGLILNPDFQRGHVWTLDQQSSFVEYILRGGITQEIRLNHPGWMNTFKGDFVCVDGLQRITALLGFLENKVPAFGCLYQDFEGIMPTCSVGIRINSLQTRKEVLQWYVDLNTGGTVHSDSEINRVKDLIEKEAV